MSVLFVILRQFLLGTLCCLARVRGTLLPNQFLPYSRLFLESIFCSPLQLLRNLIGIRPQSAIFHTATVATHLKKCRIAI